MTHGLVAHHFGSRDALIEEALRYGIQVSVEGSLSSPSGLLRDFAADFVEADPELQAFQSELILDARRRPQLRPHVMALHEAYRRAAILELARLGMADEDTAPVAFAALDGLVFQQLALTDPDATRRGVAAMGRLLSGRGGRGGTAERTPADVGAAG